MAEDKLEIVSKYRLTVIGMSFKGRTAVSKTVNLGSSPSVLANILILKIFYYIIFIEKRREIRWLKEKKVNLEMEKVNI